MSPVSGPNQTQKIKLKTGSYWAVPSSDKAAIHLAIFILLKVTKLKHVQLRLCLDLSLPGRLVANVTGAQARQAMLGGTIKIWLTHPWLGVGLNLLRC